MRPFIWGLALLGLFCGPAVAFAGERPQAAEPNEPVELQLFSAIDNGQITMAVVPHNFSVMTVRVRNNTPTDIRVELPKTFAAIPTARWQTQQMLQQQGVTESMASRYAANQGGSQGLGGSLAGPWGNGSPPANASRPNANLPNDPVQAQDQPQFWLIGAKRQFQFQVPCFCLEFGKPDPNRRIPYRFCRVDQLNEKPAIQELLEKFGQGNVDQWVAQLAAWHIASDTPWQVLAQVKPPRHSNRRTGIAPQQAILAAKTLSESLPSYGRQSRSLGDK
jgi:hypothetical protein